MHEVMGLMYLFALLFCYLFIHTSLKHLRVSWSLNNLRVDEVSKSSGENEGPGKNRLKQRLHLFCREVLRAPKGEDSPQKPCGNVSYWAEKSWWKSEGSSQEM